jgi:hypothetical protein
VKINRNQKPAKKDTSSKISWQKNKAQHTGDKKHDPVCPGHKLQYALLSFHLFNLFQVRSGITLVRL